MDKNAIKKFAVWARRDLIERVAQKAAGYGITADEIISADADSIHGELLSDGVKRQRKALITEINEKGYEQVIEEVAYTWFNRLIALRFMEVNGYLPSHIRVFTNDDGAFQPQILSEAINLDPADWDGIDMERIYALKQDNKDEELFKYLLILQCNALNAVLPEMFEKIEHYTELLLPDYLLREGSVIEQMIALIPEDDWREQVQIIGWLYQYYNSEKKDAVFEAMKKNVKVSKDNIPAATQLFTPDWIVRYMVENSLGRLWLDGHADTSARSEWKYYLDEAEQTAEVQAQLAEIREGRKNLTPEQIRFIDPCMGSGHILVYAFDVLMQIYVSCGYSERDAAHSIVQHNLWGLDLDKRAYQLAYFALMMKARQYDRRFLTRGIKPNLSHFQDLPQLNYALLDEPIRSFVQQFENADTYGSLISVQPIDGIDAAVDAFDTSLELSFTQLEHFMQLYKILSQQYDVVCTNPPYMAIDKANTALKNYVEKNYPDSKSDLFAVFIEKCSEFAKVNGYYSMITQHAWMFLTSFDKLRTKLQFNTTINMAHLGARAFDEIAGEVVQTTTFINLNSRVLKYIGTYKRLVDVNGENEKEKLFFNNENTYFALQENFTKITGMPIAYWVSDNMQEVFVKGTKLSDIGKPKQGMATADNSRFVRCWFEVDTQRISFNGYPKWFPYNNGGGFRKWYGFNTDVVNWEDSGREIKAYPKAYVRNEVDYFKPGITWNAITSNDISVRCFDEGFIFSNAGMAIFTDEKYRKYLLALINSCVSKSILKIISPTLNFNAGDICNIPVIYKDEKVTSLAEQCVEISKTDWDSFETSWDFQVHPLIRMMKPQSTTKEVRLFAKLSEERWIRAIRNGSICFSPINDFIEQALNDGNDEQGDMYEGVFARLRKDNPLIQEMRDKLGSDLEEIIDGDFILLRRISARTIPVFCAYGFYDEDFEPIGDPIEQPDGTFLVKMSTVIPDKMFDGFLSDSKGMDVWGFYCSSGHLSDQIEDNLKSNGVEFRSAIVNYSTWENEEFFIEPNDTYQELGYKRGKFSYQKESRFILYKTHQKTKYILPYTPIGDRSCGICPGQGRFEFTFRAEKKPAKKIADIYQLWDQECEARFQQLKSNEEELNRIFIDIYGLQDELTPEVEDKDVTVRKADLQREIKSLISYAVGCMFGRYSLDVEGLVYAGGELSDVYDYGSIPIRDAAGAFLIDADGAQICARSDNYEKIKINGEWHDLTFPVDADGILPICDDEYFEDDIVARFVEFIETVYGSDTLEENLKFIAAALGGKGSPREAIRNYFLNGFFADHCKIYQKRPIYWLFDSGKKNGFKCLIYLHRYRPDTIARIRTDYLHEQQGRYRTAIADYEQRIDNAGTAEKVKLTKKLNALKEQAEEARLYEEKIHHLADQMIAIDLDDGVKHNYEIFKDVLAKVK